MERLKLKFKAYLSDYIFLALAVAIVIFVWVAIYSQPTVSGKNVLLTIKVTSDKPSIVNYVPLNKSVYFDSVNQSVDFIKAETVNGDYLITLKSRGEVTSSQITFDGVRVLVGQKAEIHANYFAQGIITKAQYE